MIPLSIPVIKGNELKYVKDCLDTGWVAAGKYIDKFEKEIAKLCGTKYAVACNSGTAAIHISLIVCGVGEGDEVICPTVTFIAPVNAVKYVNANPVFMDCGDDLNLDVKKLKDFIETKCEYKSGRLINKTSGNRVIAIVPVHVFGNSCKMEEIMSLAKKYNLHIIEDATESLGSKYNGMGTGSFGDLGCFSFNGNKIITTGGGGMIVTNNKKYADKIRYLINQAKDDDVKYVHNEIGYNYRMSNLQAAVGVAQFELLNEFIKIKRKNFKIYRKLGVEFIDYQKNANYWFYAALVDDKEKVLKRLSDNDIEARPLWKPGHMQKPYKSCQAYKVEKAEELWDKIVCLPCSITLKEVEIEKVCDVLK